MRPGARCASPTCVRHPDLPRPAHRALPPTCARHPDLPQPAHRPLPPIPPLPQPAQPWRWGPTTLGRAPGRSPRCSATGRAGRCSRCAAANGYERDTCGTCGASFLAAVKDDEAPLLVLPGVGDLSRLGRPQRLLLALGVVLAVLVPLAVITLLLTQRPPVAGTTHGPPGASVPSVPAAP